MKLQSNFIEIALPHGCSPVNLLHTFRTPFTRTPFDGLRLKKIYKIARMNILGNSLNLLLTAWGLPEPSQMSTWHYLEFLSLQNITHGDIRASILSILIQITTAGEPLRESGQSCSPVFPFCCFSFLLFREKRKRFIFVDRSCVAFRWCWTRFVPST